MDQLENVSFNETLQMDLYLILKKHNIESLLEKDKWYTFSFRLKAVSENSMLTESLLLTES